MLDSLKNPLALLGRILLSHIFIYSGFGKLGNLEGTAGYIASKGLPLASLLAPATGLFELVLGAALLFGWQARWSALALALFTVLASFLFHAFWSVPADQQTMQSLMFMKNFSIVGGLLMVAAFGPGSIALGRDTHATSSRR